MRRDILILCTGNSCRSQIAQGYLQKFAGEKANIYSAGIETHGVNPLAIKTMAEDGVDISHHTSNHIDEYDGKIFDFIITVCDHANEICPYFPSHAVKLHYNFSDPTKASGTEIEILAKFREVRDLIKVYCDDFVKDKL